MKVKHLFISMIAAAFLSSAVSIDKTLAVGKNAPKIETINGTNVGNDANFQNKTKLVSFWNPKNASSRIANRNLSRLYDGNSDDIEFISICTDSDEALMNEVIKIDGLNQANNYAYSEISPRVFKDFEAKENPRAFKISSNGKILEIL